MIAGQVGFAGSSKIGNNVSIGGQAGISGHLKIGNNVHIGGGSESIVKGPKLLKNGFSIDMYLSKLFDLFISTIITNYFLSTIVADH